MFFHPVKDIVYILKREKNKVVMLKITINSIDNKTIYGEGCLCR